MAKKTPSNQRISRVLPSNVDVRRNYDRLSGWYDVLAGDEWRLAAAGVARLAPQTGERILEIGYGTGRVLCALAERVGETGHVYGIDISSGMRAVARRRLRAAGLEQRVAVAAADARALPFAPARMDAVFLSFTLELFDAAVLPLVLAECWHALRPGGRLCVVAMAAQQPRGMALSIYQWAHEHFPQLIDCRPIHAREALETAGFHVERVDRRSIWGLPVDICLGRR